MEKRYQVFVSSTYTDLIKERKAVMQTLVGLGCIPASMELFPASDEGQFEFIKRVIDDCDYYVLIIGFRYGSMDTDGVSYTEKEFDYAVEKRIRVLVFNRQCEDGAEPPDTGEDAETQAKLEAFKTKAMTGRMARPWKDPKELPLQVGSSLLETMSTFPATGWMRADTAASADVLSELNEVRKENKELSETIDEISLKQKFAQDLDLASLDELHSFVIDYLSGKSGMQEQIVVNNLAWGELFAIIAPLLYKKPTDDLVQIEMAREYFPSDEDERASKFSISQQSFYTIRSQFQAYGLIQLENAATTKGSVALFWSLTEKGHHLMLKRRTVKAEPQATASPQITYDEN